MYSPPYFVAVPGYESHRRSHLSSLYADLLFNINTISQRDSNTIKYFLR